MDSITRAEAKQLLKDEALPEDLIKHAEGVARRAESLCQILEASGHSVYHEKVVLASLLHDVGFSLPHGLDRGEASAQVLRPLGLNDLADLVALHVFPPNVDISLEAKILIYANLTTGPKGEPIDPERKLEFLERLAFNCNNRSERLAAIKALKIKRLIVSEIDELINQALTVS